MKYFDLVNLFKRLDADTSLGLGEWLVAVELERMQDSLVTLRRIGASKFADLVRFQVTFHPTLKMDFH